MTKSNRLNPATLRLCLLASLRLEGSWLENTERKDAREPSRKAWIPCLVLAFALFAVDTVTARWRKKHRAALERFQKTNAASPAINR